MACRRCIALGICTFCVVAVCLPGCGSGGSGGCACADPEPCNRVVVQGHTLPASDGSITWRGVTMSIVDDTGSRPLEGTCSIGLTPVALDDTMGISLSEIPRTIHGACVLADRWLSFYVKLGEVRALDAGTSSIEVGGWSSPPSSMATECRLSSNATLVVSGATGASLPFPELVSGDFSRTLEVSFGSAEDTCHLAASIRFTVVASDYEGMAATTCPNCFC